jgi:aminopeptidase N
MHTIDAHSHARIKEVLVRHIDLNLTVNFSTKSLKGFAKLTIENSAKADTLYLDTRDLVIEKVTSDTHENNSFKLGKEQPFIGSELAISISPETRSVTVFYHTQPNAAALQWLEPAQTAGGKEPFLFTQSQAVLARTWIPLQDSPSVRFTYTASIQVPAGLMAVMSAANDTAIHTDGIYNFSMPQPIPSYLMALAVGNFQFHAYDERCGVFAEPVTLDKAAAEFSDIPAMIKAAEELYGKYAWGRYDVLVLPPSFPFGGMENPRITFATPTILAGDKSLVSLIAHELAHSWSGNLVTNATWNDFWLNEGFTVYFESRIMEKLYGKPFSDMMDVLSKSELDETLNELGPDNHDTQLKLELNGRDPDDGMTDIAYEKGRFFLLMLEREVGRERWDAFVNNYFASHAFQSISTEKFLEYLDANLLNKDSALKARLKIHEWIYSPGLPSNCPVVESEELKNVVAESKEFMNGKEASELQVKNWTTHHWLSFLRNLPSPLPLEKMKNLDQIFHFTNSPNSEVLAQWLLLSIESGYDAADTSIEKFLTTFGRRKFVKTLFAALIKTTAGKEKAKKIYAKARPTYHSVTAVTIDEILN